MKNIARKYTETSLILRIVIGMTIGAILGVLTQIGIFAPEGSHVIMILGSLFVNALKAIAPILVFFLVISALANTTAAGNMKTVVLLYIASTIIASLVAVIGASLFPIKLTLVQTTDIAATSPEGISEVMKTLLLNIVSNPVEALTTANFIGILAWAIALGVALRFAAPATKNFFSNVAEAVSTVVRWIINLAPFGILGLVYTSVSQNGLEIFTEYGKLIVLLVSCMVFIALIINPIMVFALTRKNPYPLVLRTLKDSGITAFFTRSSAANIPVNMELCRRMGFDKDAYSVSIPLGATINMSGAAVTISVMAMCAAYTTGVTVDIPTAVILSVLAAASAAGCSGVTGGSLLLIPLACSLFGIPNDIAMQVVGIGFIIGVIQDSCETALNSSSDVLFTATAEYREWAQQGREFTMGADVPQTK